MLAILSTVAMFAPAPEPFTLKDGDRVVWLGGTVVEREQKYGHWEAALIAADKDITVRNLGWSGDTVFGDARAGFDTPAKGFERLVTLTLELKPTVIFFQYGANESFDGRPGLPRFEKGFEKLLDAVKPANARIVLFTPMKPQVVSPERTAQLAMYADAVRGLAAKRNLRLVDVFDLIAASGPVQRTDPPLTDNGVHLTAFGYRHTAAGFAKALGLTPPAGSDAVRQAVVAKNELFFHRWRPQNETYLFGFRKHEQGKNAKEIVEFDPLVADAEKNVRAVLAAGGK